MNHLRRYLETTIHDPRITEPTEDELGYVTPSDAEDTIAEPYLEGGATIVNDATFTPYSIAPDNSSSHTREHTLPTHPAAPTLPPSQQLHRTPGSIGTSRSRPEVSRQNGNGLYPTGPRAETEPLGAPSWVASGATQDSRSSWQTSQYGHGEGPYGE